MNSPIAAVDNKQLRETTEACSQSTRQGSTRHLPRLEPTAQEVKAFWREKRIPKKAGQQYESPGLPPMRLVIGDNWLFDDEVYSIRDVNACWVENNEVIGYAKGTLFGGATPETMIDSEEMILACDEISQHTYDVAEMLYASHFLNDPFMEVGETMQWLAEVGIVEVHPKHRGNGLGVKMGLQFMDVLRSKEAIGFFFFKPFPLQYSQGDGPRKYFDPEIHVEDFERDRNKLVGLYERAWGAKVMPGATDHMWLPGSPTTRQEICARGDKWSFRFKV